MVSVSRCANPCWLIEVAYRCRLSFWDLYFASIVCELGKKCDPLCWCCYVLVRSLFWVNSISYSFPFYFLMSVVPWLSNFLCGYLHLLDCQVSGAAKIVNQGSLFFFFFLLVNMNARNPRSVIQAHFLWCAYSPWKYWFWNRCICTSLYKLWCVIMCVHESSQFPKAFHEYYIRCVSWSLSMHELEYTYKLI